MIINKTGSRIFKAVVLINLGGVFFSCKHKPNPVPVEAPLFETVPEKFPIQPGIIDEASGATASINMPGYLWTILDSGGPASLFLVSTDGKSIKEFPIPDAANRDWEDVGNGPGPENGVNYIYIADIGNNNTPVAEVSTIFRIPEISDLTGSFKASNLDKIRYRLPDGARNSESILVDPLTKDLFIISKEPTESNIYRLAYPQSTSEVITAEKAGAVPGMVLATGGCVSSDGSEIMIRNYINVFYWKRTGSESVVQTITKSPTRQLQIALEPQGEGVCFDKSLNGFYTLSEIGGSSSVTLNFYKRK